MTEIGEKKKSKSRVLILIICLVILIGIGITLLFVFKSDKGTDDKTNSNKDTIEKLVLKHPLSLGKLTKVNDISNIAKLYDNSFLVDSVSDGENYDIGYDGYILNDRVVIRNGKTIMTLDKNVTTKAIKDTADPNSKYIYVACLTDYCTLGNLINDKYAYVEYYDDKEERTEIYDINTGKLMATIKDYLIVGDQARTSPDVDIYTNSSKYLVAVKEEYGLIDFSGKTIIDFTYDDLVTIDDEKLIAKEEDKFGVISSSDQIIIDFKYDGLEAFGNYLVALKDDKLGIIDYNEKVIVPFTKSVAKTSEYGYTLRPCCGELNNFSVMKMDDEILIYYYDATEKVDYSQYGYDVDYLVIKNDGTYTYEEDYLEKIYNYGNDYYYTYLTLDDTSKLTIFNKDKKVVNEYDCGQDVYGHISGFVDYENVRFSCYEDMDVISKYYNIKKNTYVNEKEVEDFEEYATYLDSGLKLISLKDKKLIATDNNRVLLTINKDDDFYSLDDDYYKLVNSDNTFEYYHYE